jgi:nucleoside phosphorylase
MNPPVTVILVPKGAEYSAVAKGVRQSRRAGVTLVPLPVGPDPVRKFLAAWCDEHHRQTGNADQRVVIMGLCGSLRSHLRVGDAVLYDRVVLDQMGTAQHNADTSQMNSLAPEIGQDVLGTEKVASVQCDRLLSSSLGQILGNTVTHVTGVMCDRVVHRADQKQALAECYRVDVVDMEGYAALTVLQTEGIAATMLRVVSDDASHDLPDLSAAFTEDGSLRAGILARQFLGHPTGAYRLIRGSLTGLKVLTSLTTQLLKG